MFVALLALFVALGGPAEAAKLINGKLLKRGSVTSKQVRNHTLTTRDLSKKTVRKLERTPRKSVNEVAIRNGAVTPGKLARGAVSSKAIADRAVRGGDIGLGAVGSLEVADGSVTGTDVADGSLDTRDFARFWGRFTIAVGQQPAGAQEIGPHSCWRGDPVGLAPERAGADISGDVINVTPGAAYPSSLTFAARVSTTPSRFTILACNPTDQPVSATNVPFNYAIFDVP